MGASAVSGSRSGFCWHLHFPGHFFASRQIYCWLLWFKVEGNWQNLRYIANLMIAASTLDLLMVVVHRQDLAAPGLSLWIYCFHLAAFGLAGAFMHWQQMQIQ